MNLKNFADNNIGPISLTILPTHHELVKDIQGKLMLSGLLDPPVDGKLGPVSSWALYTFCEKLNLSLSDGFSRYIALALLNDDSKNIFPLNPSDDFAGKIVKAMIRHGHWIARHHECRNIIYIEGCNMDGSLNDNKPNQFNDIRLVLSISEDGKPQIIKTWEATTEPGKKWTIAPMDQNGAARIAFDQYKAWSAGIHHKGKLNAHEALVQVAEVTVFRDLDKNYCREGDKTYTGIFGINQHCGYDLPHDNLGGSSAGCLVGRMTSGHKEFMSIVKNDPRYVVNNGYRFITTIMPASELEKK